jgi:Polyketide cyclase / dehydrase and lipid transport
MASYTQSIEIQAPVAIVSGILLDLAGWTSWTSTVQEATPLGTAVIAPGTRVRVRQPGLPVSVWTVDVADRANLVWNNLRHGLRTVAVHRLEDNGTGSRLTVRIDQAGPLAGPVDRVYGRVIHRHLKLMTEQLKAAAESAAGTEPFDLDIGRSNAQADQ